MFIIVITILNYVVQQKIQQLGIFKVLGLTHQDVKSILTYQIFILGVFGAGLGVIIGYYTLKIYNRYILKIGRVTSLDLSFNIWHYIIAVAMIAVTTYLTVYIICRRTEKISIIKMIKKQRW